MPDLNLPAQRLAANPHDIVAAFLSEECVLGTPGSYMLTAAALKAFEWWTDARGRRNRRPTAVMFLDHLLSVYGIEPGVVKVTVDGEETFVYAIPGIAFKHDSSLNQRLKSYLPPSLADESREVERMDYSAKYNRAKGKRPRPPPKPKPPPKPPPKPKKPPMTEEQRRAARIAYYAANKDRLSAKRKAWRKANPDKYKAAKARVNTKRRARRRAQRKSI